MFFLSFQAFLSSPIGSLLMESGGGVEVMGMRSYCVIVL